MKSGYAYEHIKNINKISVLAKIMKFKIKYLVFGICKFGRGRKFKSN